MSNVPSQSGASSAQEQKPNPISLGQSSVEIREMFGTLFLGILSLILTFTLLRTLSRNRKLEVQLAQREKAEPLA